MELYCDIQLELQLDILKDLNMVSLVVQPMETHWNKMMKCIMQSNIDMNIIGEVVSDFFEEICAHVMY